MKTKHNIQLTLDEKEKQHILKIYDDNSINVSKRVLNLIREDVFKLDTIGIAENNRLVQHPDETEEEFRQRVKEEYNLKDVKRLERWKMN